MIPRIEGIDDFAGPAFHSAEWDHDVELEGKSVAVLGTGASAVQFVPEVAKVAAQTTIYQRSAPWILPKADRSYPEWERRLFERFPARVAAARLGFAAVYEFGTYGFTGTDWVHAAGCRKSPTAPGGRSSPTRRSSPRPRPTTRWAASGSSSRTTGTRP